MRAEAQWWLNTAEGDLGGAHVLLDARRFNLAAFHSQQAAEKALKALLAEQGKAHRGHACIDLVDALRHGGETLGRELEMAARRLDLHYVQSRYPNGLGGDPTHYYDEDLARECLRQAEAILAFARSRLTPAA